MLEFSSLVEDRFEEARNSILKTLYKEVESYLMKNDIDVFSIDKQKLDPRNVSQVTKLLKVIGCMCFNELTNCRYLNS